MTEQEKYKEKYEYVCVRLGSVMNQWGLVMWNLDLSLCFFRGESPPKIESLSRLADKSDSKKINTFVAKYKKNSECHNNLNSQAVGKLLHAGLDSRNYFAHRIFLVENENILARPKKGDKSHPQAKLIPVTLESLDEERENVINSYTFIDALVEKQTKQAYEKFEAQKRRNKS